MRTRGMLIAGLLLSSGPAWGHGLWGHIHVTGWAVENMPDDDLRAFLLEPEVFNALLFGATFADTGYAVDNPASRAYSEHSHWEPFIEDYVQWILENDPPPWDDSLASRKRVAFLLGCASHGLQDSIFDSLFLYQLDEHDGVGQEQADPGTDGFLVLDEHIRFVPQEDIPMSTVLELFASLEEEVTADVIEDAVALVTSVYINDAGGLGIAAALGTQYADAMPWGRAHYLDPDVPGSLRAEIYPTMRYQQAIWARLHGALEPDDVVAFAFPEPPRRLRSHDAASVDSWITLIFGAGVHYDSILTELTDESGQPVPFSQANTRWGADHTRLVRLQPDQDLTPGAWYTATLAPGAALISGDTTAQPYPLSFQVACLEPEDPACPALGDVPVASIDGIPADGDTGQAPPLEDGACGCMATKRGMGGGGLLLAGLLVVVQRRRTTA